MYIIAETNISFTIYFIGCLFNAHIQIHDKILIPYYV